MTPCEMQDAIATLQRDMKETMREVGDLGYRVFQLEKANWPKPKEPPRFQTGYAGYEPRRGAGERPAGQRWGGSG